MRCLRCAAAQGPSPNGSDSLRVISQFLLVDLTVARVACAGSRAQGPRRAQRCAQDW